METVSAVPVEVVSTMMTRAAASARYVTPQTTVQTSPGWVKIGGRKITDAHIHGLLTVEQVVAKSSNVGTAPGDRHYYRVQGPTLLIEHDNTQGNGTHIHSAWRNPADDFGDDALAAHYRAHHA